MSNSPSAASGSSSSPRSAVGKEALALPSPPLRKSDSVSSRSSSIPSINSPNTITQNRMSGSPTTPSLEGWLAWRPTGTSTWSTSYLSIEYGSLIQRTNEAERHRSGYLIQDLRGTKITTRGAVGEGEKWNTAHASIDIDGIVEVRPAVASAFNSWLNALTWWSQQVRPYHPPAMVRSISSTNANERDDDRRSLLSLKRSTLERPLSSCGYESGANVRGLEQELQHLSIRGAPGVAHRRSMESLRSTETESEVSGTIVKAGSLLLWDVSIDLAPVYQKDPRKNHDHWKRVSCILYDNGNLHILRESDGLQIMRLQIAQFKRSCIQLVHPSLLGTPYTVAIYSKYVPGALNKMLYIAAPDAVVYESWYVLLRCFAQGLYGNPEGTFRVQQSLYMRVADARGLSEYRSSNSNGLYFEVVVGGEICARSAVVSEDEQERWLEDFEFRDFYSRRMPVVLLLKEIDKKGVKTVVGHTELDEKALMPRYDAFETWYPVRYVPGVNGGRNKEQGALLIRMRVDESTILREEEYVKVTKLMQDYSNNVVATLRNDIIDMDRIALLFIRISIVDDTFPDLMTHLAELDLKHSNHDSGIHVVRKRSEEMGSNVAPNPIEEIVAGREIRREANGFFRENTLLTKVMDYTMKRVGGAYLQEILGKTTKEICEKDILCEVDPARLKSKSGDELKVNWRNLIGYVKRIWKAIYDNPELVPHPLPILFKRIRDAATSRYGPSSQTKVRYPVVAGFLFLRFIVPAILNPRVFGLMRTHPSPNAQRTLTLIAKSLQGFANAVPFGVKEPWMTPMNDFAQDNLEKLWQFIDTVSTPKDERFWVRVPGSHARNVILERLPKRDREGVPTLPYVVDRGKEVASLVQIYLHWVNDKTNNIKLEGAMLEFHKECERIDKLARQLRATQENSLRSGPCVATSEVLPWELEPIPADLSLVLTGRSTRSSMLGLPSPSLIPRGLRPGSPCSSADLERSDSYFDSMQSQIEYGSSPKGRKGEFFAKIEKGVGGLLKGMKKENSRGERE
ncbi:Rho GTPase activation protein [Saitoella complicata NRRL Y-17804]|nr:Rho GTPase activation protein [Saitoella complicata NRRL Y-17804]ODQ50321.1 Rho GTPase activation protein [Saitoella complicata NRRL Y-17804]